MMLLWQCNYYSQNFLTLQKKAMIIERTEKEVIIRIPGNMDTSDIQEMIDFVQYKEITSKSQAKPQEIADFLKTYKTGRNNEIRRKTNR